MSKLDTSQILKCQGEREKKKKIPPKQNRCSAIPTPGDMCWKTGLIPCKKKKIPEKVPKRNKGRIPTEKKKKVGTQGATRVKRGCFIFCYLIN